MPVAVATPARNCSPVQRPGRVRRRVPTRREVPGTHQVAGDAIGIYLNPTVLRQRGLSGDSAAVDVALFHMLSFMRAHAGQIGTRRGRVDVHDPVPAGSCHPHCREMPAPTNIYGRDPNQLNP